MWLSTVTIIWFYMFLFPAMLSIPAWFLFGVWRLVRRPEYRGSLYGWLWPLLMLLNLCLFAAVLGL